MYDSPRSLKMDEKRRVSDVEKAKEMDVGWCGEENHKLMLEDKNLETESNDCK